MKLLEKDSSIRSLEDVSDRLGIPLYFLYQWSSEDVKERLHYKTVTIDKKSGGNRILSIPSPVLKKAQRGLLSMLEQTADLSPAAKAYRKGSSLTDNASCHCDTSLLVKADISDFFASITFSQVFWVMDQALRAAPCFGSDGNEESLLYNRRLSWFLSKVCTLNGSLPQGAPTSPLLSNMVMAPIDRRILGYCQRRRIVYTRYADDMSFSGDGFSSQALLFFLRRLLDEHGFSLNEKKTAVLGPGKQRRITGITVSSKLQAPVSYRKEIRQEMHYIGKFGLRSHMERKGLLVPFAQEYAKEMGVSAVPSDFPQLIHYTRRLLGRIQFVLQINPQDREFLRYKEECLLLLRQLPWALLP